MQIQLAAESHVPCFQERVGTGQSRYMIAVRLPWRLRARPSATLHEIQVRSEEQTCCDDVTECSGERQGRICGWSMVDSNNFSAQCPPSNSLLGLAKAGRKT
jgi:hypothetical protein